MDRIRQATGWYALHMTMVLAVMGYASFMLFEHSRADTTVGLTVVSTGMSMSCDGAVSLGTLQGNGDTGIYSTARKTTCTIHTANALGYNLHWQVRTGSGGTSTGRLISENEDTIRQYKPLVAGTPEVWNVAAGSGAWGGRLSSTSTTFSSATWGTDGSNATEKWLNVATGGLVIANRTTATGPGGDVQNIGFRLEIGSSVTQPAGIYRAVVVLTATTN